MTLDAFFKSIGKQPGEELSPEERNELIDIVIDAPDPESDGVGEAVETMCFPAGTMVKVADGYKSIEDMAPFDDYVWSCKTKKGTLGACELRQVTRTYKRQTDELCRIDLAESSIKTTPQHPFYVYGRGTVSASKLKVGMTLVGFNRQAGIVTGLSCHREPSEVHNIEVEGNHNYYIKLAESSGALAQTCALVHNCNFLSSKRGKAAGQALLTAAAVFGGRVHGKKTSNSTASRALHERQKVELRRAMERPHVEDVQLSKMLNELYRPNAAIGSGSTAAAVRHEAATGTMVGGKLHAEKARNYLAGLREWLRRNPSASPGDRAAAENIIMDIEDALRQ